ncbi:hypothetical protein [Geitlerinema sp. PCC 7407]|uniref:hypothetical protein n=1 Tax=Geitlerinema sp. PCC 7407 TaxID=1173025 RepID=UPI00029FF182|nr:hypothetical protein [Geitlerinema sp. PCC 7407]AFY67168.1 hypothetical protein GEI7407_2695 [Geitlerinema sp. PCC 7407]
MGVFLGAIAVIVSLFLWLLWLGRSPSSPGRSRKIAVLGRPSRGKLLRKTASRLRRDYPGQTEDWYWQKAQDIVRRSRG